MNAPTTHPHVHAARVARWGLPALIALTCAAIVASLFIGAYDLGTEGGPDMFLITRVPRTLALVLSGAAMAVSGMVLQQLTQNRFVEPTTSGTSEWAALGLMVSMIAAPEMTLTWRMVVASVSAFIGTMVFMVVLRRIRVRDTLVVPIVGIMLGAVVSSATTLLALSTDSLQTLTVWFTGTFTSIVRGQYEVLWIVALICVIVHVLSDRLTVVGLGRDISVNVGINYDRVVLLGSAAVAAASGITTVVVGFLPFIGLVVPNIVSILRGDDLRSNLVWVTLGGTLLTVACDILGRVVRAPFEVPASTILGVLGAVVFLALISQMRGRSAS